MAELSLVTGFPGFIGRRLVGHLLEVDPDARVVALVEGRMADRAREAAAALGADRIEVHHSVAFDVRRAEGLLAPSGLRPPRFGEYVDAMVRFFRAHEDDPAFWPNAS